MKRLRIFHCSFQDLALGLLEGFSQSTSLGSWRVYFTVPVVQPHLWRMGTCYPRFLNALTLQSKAQHDHSSPAGIRNAL